MMEEGEDGWIDEWMDRGTDRQTDELIETIYSDLVICVKIQNRASFFLPWITFWWQTQAISEVVGNIASRSDRCCE